MKNAVLWAFPAWAFFSNATTYLLVDSCQKEYAYVYVHKKSLTETEHSTPAIDDFFECENLINSAFEHQLPVICIVPNSLEGFSPLSDLGKEYEDARVALAWTSIAHRFKNMPIRIVKTDKPYSLAEIASFAGSALESEMSPAESPEISVAGAVMLAQDLAAPKRAFECRPYITSTAKNERRCFDIESRPECTRRIIITGGAGFIAHHIIKQLLGRGDQVIAIDSMICANHKNIEPFLSHPHFTFIHADCSEPFTVTGDITDIIHAASIPSPEYYYSLPDETMRSGLRGIVIALELATEKNARLLFTSTSEVYGDPEVSPQKESYHGRVSPLGKRCQYDESKRGAEAIIAEWVDRIPLDIRIARIFNTYGPHMQLHDGRVVTNFIAAAIENRPITVYGSGSQTRSFAFVSDTVDGLIRLLDTRLEDDAPISNRVFNIGTPQEFTIQELANIFCEIYERECGQKPTVRFLPNPDTTDPRQRLPDISAAQKMLGFNPRVPLREGLMITIRSFLNERG